MSRRKKAVWRPTQLPGAHARKPVYLARTRGGRVDVRDDQLVLYRDARLCWAAPLARIARIITDGGVDWSGTSLVRCLHEGIPITWLDGPGPALGSSLPRTPCHSELSTLLEHYVELPRWPEHFENWAQRRRLALVFAHAARAKEAGTPLTREVFRDLRRRFGYQNRAPEPAPNAAQAWCDAFVASHLVSLDLRLRYPGYGGLRLELGAELGGLLWAWLALERGEMLDAAADEACAVHLFEPWVAHQAAALDDHLADLQRHAADSLQTQ